MQGKGKTELGLLLGSSTCWFSHNSSRNWLILKLGDTELLTSFWQFFNPLPCWVFLKRLVCQCPTQPPSRRYEVPRQKTDCAHPWTILLRKSPNRGMGSNFCTATTPTFFCWPAHIPSCCCELTVSEVQRWIQDTNFKLRLGKLKGKKRIDVLKYF